MYRQPYYVLPVTGIVRKRQIKRGLLTMRPSPAEKVKSIASTTIESLPNTASFEEKSKGMVKKSRMKIFGFDEIFINDKAMVEQIRNSNFGTDDYIRIIQNYCDLHEKEGISISNCFERLDDENMAMYFYLGIVSLSNSS